MTVNLPSENPFDQAEVAERYEAWYRESGRAADLLEKRLLRKLLAEFPNVRTMLDVGCGTGHFTRWLAEAGLAVTGLDASDAMLAEARRWNGAGYVLGDALRLPFEDRSFDLAAMITTLEFVDDPLGALQEAARVARRGVLLGVLNRWSALARNYRASGKPVWRKARFFSPFELKALVRKATGDRLAGASWRTTLWPLPMVRELPLPWGGFIGLAAHFRDEGK